MVKESLLISLVYGIDRRSAADVTLGGYPLPPEVCVTLSPYITHHLPEICDEPDRFIPERWHNPDPSPHEYLPLNWRACVRRSDPVHPGVTLAALPVDALDGGGDWLAGQCDTRTELGEPGDSFFGLSMPMDSRRKENMLRVALSVDGLNMLKAADRIKQRINFGELARAVTTLNGSRNREIVFQRFYIGPASESNVSERISRLRNEVMAFGYEWIQCSTDNAYAKQRTTTVDTVIPMDMLAWAYCHTVDVVALCSGDGGFAEVIRRAKVLGLRVEVYAIRSSNHIAVELEQQAHPILDLEALGVLRQGNEHSMAHLFENVRAPNRDGD